MTSERIGWLKWKRGDKTRGGRCLLGVSLLLAVLFAFLFGHYDCEAITRWGYDLLVCIKAGNAASFPEYTYEMFGAPTNYTLFVNGITALWLLPLYLLDQAVKAGFGMSVYENWYKLFLCGVLILDLAAFDALLKKLTYEKRERLLVQGLFATSTVTLLAALGKGQVDLYGLLFFLLGAAAMKEEKYVKMSLLFGVALLVKPTVLLLLVPLYLLLISRWRQKVLLYLAVLFLPYAGVLGLTRLWMPRYLPLSRKTFALLAEALGGLTIREQFFDLQVNQILIFASAGLILCFACYYLGMHQQVKTEHLMAFPPLLLICFGMFVCASYHWFLYLLPAFLLMGRQYRKKSDFYFLYLGMNLGLVCYFLAAETPRFLTGDVIQYTGEWQQYLILMGKTLFYVCMLLVGAVFFFEKRVKSNEKEATGDKEEERYQRVLLILQPLPAAVYLVFSLMVSFW